MATGRGIPVKGIESMQNRSMTRVEKFLVENLAGYVDCGSNANKTQYKKLKKIYEKWKFNPAEKQSLEYIMWYTLIEHCRVRKTLDDDIERVRERERQVGEEAERLAEYRESGEVENYDEEELLQRIEDELKGKDADPKMYILNLRKTAQEDQRKIEALQQSLAVMTEARKRENLIINTPSRPKQSLRFASAGTSRSGENRPPNSSSSDGRENRTLMGEEIRSEDSGEEDNRESDHSRARQIEADNKALKEVQMGVFTGAASDKPFGNNFARFLCMFEEYAGCADEKTKKFALTQRLRGMAQEMYFHKMEEIEGPMNYESIVELMKSIFYSLEVDSSKMRKFRELHQREDELLDVFFITFKIQFKGYIEIVTGQTDETIGGGKMMCRNFYQKIRPTLRNAFDKRHPFLWEEWNNDPCTIETMYEELKGLEAAFPPRQSEERQPPRGPARPFLQQRPRPPYDGQQRNTAPASSLGLRCRRCGRLGHVASNCFANLNNRQTNQERTPFPPPSRGQSIRTDMIRPQVNRNKTPQSQRQNFDPRKRYGDGSQAFKGERFSPQQNGANGNRQWKNAPTNNSRGGFGGRNQNRQQTTFGNGRQNNFNNQQQKTRINATENTNQSQRNQQVLIPVQQQPDWMVGQQNTYPSISKIETGSPLAMFNYTPNANKNNGQERNPSKFHPIRLEVDEDRPFNPEHCAPLPVFKCHSTQKGWTKVTRFSLWKNHLKENDNPPWIREASEDFIKECDDIVEWAKSMRDYQDSNTWPEETRNRILRNRQVREECVDSIQFRFALIILDVYIEDVLFDTGSMYNAISARAFWALAGRFDSFMKAFSEANWDPRMKTVGVVGGGSMPVLATVEMDVQTSTGNIIPLVWAIYDDVDFIIIVGTVGMRALKFQCRTPELNNHDLFKGKQKSEEIAAKFYESAIAPFNHLEVGKMKEDPESEESSTEEKDDDNSHEECDEEIEQMLMSNESAVKFIADAATMGAFVTPDERNSLLGGLLLETALEDRIEPLIELEESREEDFRPENIPEEESKAADNNALIRAINRQLEQQDFPFASLEPKPPNYCE